MNVQMFPSDPSQSVGRFTGNDADNSAAGVCRVRSDLIEIEVSERLTPWVRAAYDFELGEDRTGGRWAAFVLHGDITQLACLGAHTTHRWAVYVPIDGAPEFHRASALTGAWRAPTWTDQTLPSPQCVLDSHTWNLGPQSPGWPGRSAEKHAGLRPLRSRGSE